MTISRVGTGTPDTGVTPRTPTYPTVSGGILATDHLVCVAWSSTATPPTNPSGFTSLVTATAGGSSPSLRISIKKAAGGETGTLSVASTKAVLYVYRGVDNTTPQDVAAAAGGSGTAATAMAVPALTTTAVGAALIIAATSNASSTFTPPSLPAAFTEILDDIASPTGTVDQLIWSGSGATDAGGATAITQSLSSRYATAMAALRAATVPAQVGTVTPTADVGQVALAWSAPGDGGYPITDYVVQYRTNAGPGSWNTFADATSASTGATVTGLVSGTAYDFQVAAVNAIGQGAYSSAVTGTPTAATAGGVGLSRSPSRRRSRSRR